MVNGLNARARFIPLLFFFLPVLWAECNVHPAFCWFISQLRCSLGRRFRLFLPLFSRVSPTFALLVYPARGYFAGCMMCPWSVCTLFV